MFDIVVLAIIGILTIIGLWKGFLKQFFGLLGLVTGYILAMRLYHPVSKYLTGIDPGTARIISFIAIFLASILIVHLIGWVVGRRFGIARSGFISRIGGALLGFLKGCLIVALVVMLIITYLPGDAALFKKSSTIGYIRIVTAALRKVSRADIKAKYDEKVGTGKPLLQKEK